jgi:polysaccharide export outer membrane protein
MSGLQVRTRQRETQRWVALWIAVAGVCALSVTSAMAQTPGTAPNGPAVSGAATPAGYVIGPEDVLSVLFWREKDLSADVAVRPDGKISLPLINDLDAAGLTPDQLREKITKEATKYIEDPNVTVVVKQINSRKVFITGMVAKPGPYPLIAPTTVIQLIAMAGGLQEFADGKNIVIMRTEQGKQVSYRFNYKEVVQRKKLDQNIELKPGDTIVVPE